MASIVSTKATPDTDGRRVITTGEILPNGGILELVSGFADNKLRLLLRKKDGKQTVAREIEDSGSRYQAPEAERTVLRTIRFPHQARSYGSPRKLFRRVQNLFELHAGLGKGDAALMTAWVATTWFPDCLSSPPTLIISGPDMEHAVILFRLLQCLCRRPVLLGDLNRNTFLSFASWAATLLINQPSLSGRLGDLLVNSNYSGVWVVGNGKSCSPASSKAVFMGMADSQDRVGIHFALHPRLFELALFGGQQQSLIADEIQPEMLMYRARNFETVRNFTAEKHGSIVAGGDIARSLTASVLGEIEIMELISPTLQNLEREKMADLGCDVHHAIVEAVWAPSHQHGEITVSRLTELVNVLLHLRGELLEYSPMEIGWKLRGLGFKRDRNGQGMVLRFSLDNRILLHRRARAWGLDLVTFAGCDLCSPGEQV